MTRTVTYRSVGLILALGMFVGPMVSPLAAQAVFESEEFQINVDERGRQINPIASFHRSGRFVTVWESRLRGVVARFFHRNRAPMGQDMVLQANDPIGPLPFRGMLTVHEDPVVAMTGGPTFLLFWIEEEQNVSIDIFFESRDTLSRHLFGQAFGLDGRPAGNRFRVGQVDLGQEQRAEVAVDDAGNVTVTWSRLDDGEEALFVRRFDADGQALTSEVRVDNGAGSSEASQPTVASLADGTSLVVWEACCDGGGPGGELGVFGRFFDPQGDPLSDSFQINTTLAGNQRVPVTVGEGGRFVVAWQGPTGEVQGDRDVFRIYGRRVNLDSGLSGDEKILSSGPEWGHSSPAMAVGLESDVVLVWMGWIGSFREAVYGTRLSLEDNQVEPKSDVFRISERTIGGQFQIGLSATPLGRFLAVWEGFGDDGNLRLAARLVLPASLVACVEGLGSLTSKTPGASPCEP